MKALKIERAGAERFHFVLEGEVDPAGARSVDRLLFTCQARGARDVRLDFSGVTSICTLGTAVLVRQGKVYQDTERRIQVIGLSPEIRRALMDVEAIVYETNAGAAPDAMPAMPDAAAAPADAPAAAAPAAVPDVIPPREDASDEIALLQSKLKRKLVEFRNLFEITRALNLAVDLDELLNLFSLSIMGQFGVERVAVFLVEPRRGGLFAPRQVRGFPSDHFRDFTMPADVLEHRGADEEFLSLGDLGSAEAGIEALRASGLEWLVPLRVRRNLEGLVFLGGRGAGRGFHEDERDLLTTLCNQGAVAIANAQQRRAQEDRNLGLVRGMMSLIESRDEYARGTTERVVRYVTAVSKLLNVPKPALKSLVYGAALRDIGMIAVSHLILKNPAHLSDDEWALIKQHPERGARILEEMDFPSEVIDVVRHHHERWGGEGYPDGLRGNEIPLGARIVSLVDSYVAMTGERPYRRALPFDKARQVVAENWGTPFDPSVVEMFLQVLDNLERRSRQRPNASSSNASPPEGADAGLEPGGPGAIPLESHP
ncbi:MAG TPA: HD domain-containing phosphohydrolase [Candidatus Eisenbacteria bacterium]|nr:HD domain-containing phosphohydrolase [Candidatus Eisenbacteria bacterium]